MSNYPDEPGYVRGSETSQEAAESVRLSRQQMWVRAWKLLVREEPKGLTSDDLEAITGWLHQSASARLRELVINGLAYDVQGPTGKRDTRNGRKARIRRPLFPAPGSKAHAIIADPPRTPSDAHGDDTEGLQGLVPVEDVPVLAQRRLIRRYRSDP